MPPQSRNLIITSCLLGLLIPGLALSAAPVSPQELVERANGAAERQDYPAAIRLYEQVVQKVPGDKTLKSNLAVLYANYGVTLQEQKKFAEAMVQFDKAAPLVSPGTNAARNINNARASLHFAQAIDLKDTTENPKAEDFSRQRALLEKALALSPHESAFRKAMAGTYLEEAYLLATDEKYADAAPLLEKARTYAPENAAIKQSLANVYLGMAKQNPAERQQWLDKALATDNSPTIQQGASRITSLEKSADNTTSGFAARPDEVSGQAPAEMNKLSVIDMLNDMETQLQIKPGKNAMLAERLEVLEKQVLGKKQDGPIAARTKTAYIALMGTMSATRAEDARPNLVQAPAAASENSYLEDIFRMTDGKVIRWGKFPLRVYFEDPGKDGGKNVQDSREDSVQDATKGNTASVSPLFKPEYKEAALEGFRSWKEKTDGFANFVEIKNPDAADIIVSWQDEYVDRFADPDKTPDVYRSYTPPKRSPLLQVLQVASMFTPGYFSLAPQALAAGLQYKQYKQMSVLRDESRIKLGLNPTRDLNPDAARLLIRNMAAKEFGHALGLKGSSNKPGDLLYPDLRSDIAQLPTIRDVETLRELYNRPPNIILNVR